MKENSWDKYTFYTILYKATIFMFDMSIKQIPYDD